MKIDGYDLLRQVKNAFCQLEMLTETHKRTLAIVEEKRAEIDALKVENEHFFAEITRLKGV